MTVNSIGAVQSVQRSDMNSLIEKSFVLMPDRAVREMAREKTNEQYNDLGFRKKVNAVFYSLPVIGAASAAAMTKGSPARKAMAGAKNGALWAGAVGVLGLYDVASRAVLKNSPKIQESVQKHPVASTIADLSLAFLSVDLGTRLINRGLADVKPSKKVVGAINNSKFVKEFIPKVTGGLENVVAKAPELVKQMLPAVKKAGNFVVKNAPLLAIGGILVAGIGNSLKKDRIYNNNYDRLKDMQLDVAQNIISDEINAV